MKTFHGHTHQNKNRPPYSRLQDSANADPARSLHTRHRALICISCYQSRHFQKLISIFPHRTNSVTDIGYYIVFGADDEFLFPLLDFLLVVTDLGSQCCCCCCSSGWTYKILKKKVAFIFLTVLSVAQAIGTHHQLVGCLTSIGFLCTFLLRRSISFVLLRKNSSLELQPLGDFQLLPKFCSLRVIESRGTSCVGHAMCMSRREMQTEF